MFRLCVSDNKTYTHFLAVLQKLFELAIERSLEPGLGAQHQWYPYTYHFSHLFRRAEFLVTQASQLLG